MKGDLKVLTWEYTSNTRVAEFALRRLEDPVPRSGNAYEETDPHSLAGNPFYGRGGPKRVTLSCEIEKTGFFLDIRGMST